MNKQWLLFIVRGIALVILLAASLWVYSVDNADSPLDATQHFILNISPFILWFIIAWLGGRLGILTAPLPFIGFGLLETYGPHHHDHDDLVWASYCMAGVLGLPLGLLTSAIHRMRSRRQCKDHLISSKSSSPQNYGHNDSQRLSISRNDYE